MLKMMLGERKSWIWSHVNAFLQDAAFENEQKTSLTLFKCVHLASKLIWKKLALDLAAL